MALLFVVSCGNNDNKTENIENLPDKILPPLQSSVGPGGNNYKFHKISSYFGGEYELKYFVYYPVGVSEALPLVIFLHGYSAISPDYYGYWIEHIVKKGAIVIYPLYQTQFSVNVDSMYSNAITAITNAILNMDKIKIKRLPGAVTIGHSLGGIFAVNIATEYEKLDFPTIKGVFAAEPGSGVINTYKNYSLLTTDQRIVLLSGENDIVVGSNFANYIYDNAKNVSNGYITKIFLYSDTKDNISLLADHFAPLSSGENTLNTFDWNGFWKWSVALIDCTYYNKNCDYIADIDTVSDLGNWSNGEAVKKPKVEIK